MAQIYTNNIKITYQILWDTYQVQIMWFLIICVCVWIRL